MLADKVYELFPSLFPKESTEQHRTFLLYAVWTTVRDNPGITENKLRWLLENRYSFSQDDINRAIAALVNPEMFDSVSRYELTLRKTGKTVAHLRPKKPALSNMKRVENMLIAKNPALWYLKAS